MATNPYYTTINFPVETLGTGETWQLILKITTAVSGDTVSEDSFDHGLTITDHGTLSWEYDVDNLLLVPGETQLKLADTENYLHDFLFAISTISDATDKKFEVTIKVDTVEEFTGYVLEDDLSYDGVTKIISFSAASQITLLNNTPLYETGEAIKDPIGYGANLTSYYTITQLISDIYSFMGVSSGSFWQDWTFGDEDGTESITFGSLEMQPGEIYNNLYIQLENLGDVLKCFANTFCCRTGIRDNTRFFFVKNKYYSTVSSQTIVPFEYDKEFKYPKTQYCKYSFYEDETATAKSHNTGDFTNLDSSKIERTVIPYGYYIDPIYYANMYYDSGGFKKHIYRAKDPIFWDTYASIPQISTSVQWITRQDMRYLMVHKFKVKGFTYDLTTTVLYDSKYFQITSMRKNWKAGYTEMECFYCAAVA